MLKIIKKNFKKFYKKKKKIFDLKNYLKKFKKNLTFLKNKKLKKFYNKSLIFYFVSKNNLLNLYVSYAIKTRINKKYSFVFNKFSIFTTSFYKYYWHFYRSIKTNVSLYFFLRNFIITVNRYKFYRFISLGFITLLKKQKNIKTYHILFIKIFFTHFVKFFERNLEILFTKLSKKINLFIFYLQYYVKKFNLEIFKKKFLKLYNLIFYYQFKLINLKKKKKARRKKFIIKKKRKYFF